MDPYSYTAFISSFWAQDFHISTEDPLERPPKIPIASSISENMFTQWLAYTITTAALVIKSGAEGPPNILAKKYREIRDDKNTIFTIFAYSLCLLIYFCAVFLTTEDHWRGLATLFNLGLSTEVLNYSSKYVFLVATLRCDWRIRWKRPSELNL